MENFTDSEFVGGATEATVDARLPVIRPPALRGEVIDRDFAAWLVEEARVKGLDLVGPDGVLAGITKSVLEAALDVEMTAHLGYEAHAAEGRGSGNSRNGRPPKTVRSEIGDIELRIPRDRNGTFEPVTVPKNARSVGRFAEGIISLYGKGLTTGEIQRHLEETYGTEISKETISQITESVIGELNEWQSRPLEAVWPVIFIDAIFVKIRGGQVANRPIYVAMGVNLLGQREVLGMWVGPTGGEGAKFWGTILSELKNRGIVDVCFVCCDGLKGLPQSINATWPEAIVQTCVVHMVRATLRYASKADWQALTKEMRVIYTSATVEAAETEYLEFTEKWGERYPAIIKMWDDKWAEFVPFLKYPPEIRNVIYTTNAIESLNSRFRRATRVRGHFPTEQSALKVLYLTIRDRNPRGGNPTGRVRNWKQALNAFAMFFGDRIIIN